MQVIVSGHHLDMTDALKDYSQKKIGKIDKFFSEAITDGKVELIYHKTKSPEKSCEAKVFLYAHGARLTAHEENADMYAAIDIVFEKLEKQLKKYKDKIKNRKKDKVSVAINEADKLKKDLNDDTVSNKDEPIVYVAKHSYKPMTIDEAVLQMQQKPNKEFMVFVNADDKNHINVLYRRKDHDFGLIEPKV